MQTLVLNEAQIIEKINSRETFIAEADDGSFTLKIAQYVPVLAAAIHNGGRLRQALLDNCSLNNSERYYEEDPHTGSFIQQQPITLIAHDSRYEYDLNRNTDECVYETAWGKEVWTQPLGEREVALSKAKHARFYRIVDAVVSALQTDFGQCVVYDNHSYNYKRHQRSDLPVLNVGTTSVNNITRWRGVIDSWLASLNTMSVPGVDITVAENDIFYGKGYLAYFCHHRFENVLVLATESKKVFMDELTGDALAHILPTYTNEYNRAIIAHSTFYISKITV